MSSIKKLLERLSQRILVGIILVIRDIGLKTFEGLNFPGPKIQTLVEEQAHPKCARDLL